MKEDQGKVVLESMSQLSWYNDWLLGKIAKYLSGSILEVGCGIGNFTKSLLLFGKVSAIDLNKEYITLTKKSNKSAEVGFGDIEKGKYFFKKKKFNSIVCFNVLEHIKDDELAIKNLIKLLKPEGYLIIIVPAHPKLYGEIDKSIYHYRRYNKKQLEQALIDNGLSLVESRRINLLGAIGWFIAGRIFKNPVIQEDKVKIFNLIGPSYLFLEKFIKMPLGISILLVAKK